MWCSARASGQRGKSAALSRSASRALKGPEKVAANAPARAKTLKEILTSLGPTFIKVGQALSIRSDLLSPVYCETLAELQDAVPPFPSDEAKATITEELGLRDISDVFRELSPEPIASASLGQVYRGHLQPVLGGDEVTSFRCLSPPGDALEGKRPQRRSDRRLDEVAKSVGGGYCRLQMPLKLALAVRETVAGHRLGALEGRGVPTPGLLYNS